MVNAALAILAAIGLASLLAGLFSVFLLPVGSVGTLRVYLLASGNGDEVEHTLRGLYWLSTWGILRAKVDILDAGLNGAGRAQVRYLIQSRYPSVHFVTTRTETDKV